MVLQAATTSDSTRWRVPVLRNPDVISWCGSVKKRTTLCTTTAAKHLHYLYGRSGRLRAGGSVVESLASVAIPAASCTSSHRSPHVLLCRCNARTDPVWRCSFSGTGPSVQPVWRASFLAASPAVEKKERNTQAAARGATHENQRGVRCGVNKCFRAVTARSRNQRQLGGRWELCRSVPHTSRC